MLTNERVLRDLPAQARPVSSNRFLNGFSAYIVLEISGSALQSEAKLIDKVVSTTTICLNGAKDNALAAEYPIRGRHL